MLRSHALCRAAAQSSLLLPREQDSCPERCFVTSSDEVGLSSASELMTKESARRQGALQSSAPPLLLHHDPCRFLLFVLICVICIASVTTCTQAALSRFRNARSRMCM